MQKKRKSPRILVVTPEITYLPEGMGNMINSLHAKAGGLADVSASLVAALFRQGADVHVALPHYRRMFHIDVGNLISDELRVYMNHLHNSRIHLAEDRIFYYRDTVYSNYSEDSILQRSVRLFCGRWLRGSTPSCRTISVTRWRENITRTVRPAF